MDEKTIEECLNLLSIGISKNGGIEVGVWRNNGTSITKALTTDAVQTRDFMFEMFNSYLQAISPECFSHSDEMSLEEFYNNYHEAFDSLDEEELGHKLGWMNVDLLRDTIEHAVEEYIENYDGLSAEEFIRHNTNNRDMLRWILAVEKKKKSKSLKHKKRRKEDGKK